MRTKNAELSPHSKKILDLLGKSAKPLSAYDILGALHGQGIKAPPTVYRALDSLLERGLVHRIETLNAFVACHSAEDCHDHKQHGKLEHVHTAHHAKFAVCNACGKAIEIIDEKLTKLIQELGKKLKFRIEREIIELSGSCAACNSKVAKA